MQGAGVSDERILSLLPDLKEIYLGRMTEQLTADDMTLLPDVVPVLRSLEEASDVTLGLLTGNWEGGARSKLACFDLNLFFPFGAFGTIGLIAPTCLRWRWSGPCSTGVASSVRGKPSLWVTVCGTLPAPEPMASGRPQWPRATRPSSISRLLEPTGS